MKILVLNNDLMERSVIQHVLQRNGHEIVSAENSQMAWDLLQSENIRFVIADRATSDMEAAQFVQRIRSAKLPGYVYILLVTPKIPDVELSLSRSGVDDYIYKPIAPLDLKSRVAIGERILKLGDRLSLAKGQLEHIAMLDPITDLLNTKAFLSTASAEVERARRDQTSFSLIMLGIDNFTTVKETFGEETSDNVLRLVTKVIREKSRPYDCVGRWEEAEFVIALPGVVGPDAEKIAGRIITGVRSMRISAIGQAAPLNIQISSGIATINTVTVSTELEPLLHQAHQAMLRAREAGGNQVYFVFA